MRKTKKRRNVYMNITGLTTVAFFLFITSASAQSHDSLADNPVLFLGGAQKLLHWTEPCEPSKIAGLYIL